MKSTKCPNCGANIVHNNSKDVIVCEFCNSVFANEKETLQNNTSNGTQTIINNYYVSSSNQPNNNYNKSSNTQTFNTYRSSQRPEVNVGIAIVLLVFCWWIGLIYIFAVKRKQKKWDMMH